MKVDALSKATSTITIRGKVFEETVDTVTLHVGNSLYEIPRKSILSMTDVEGAEAKTVDVSIDRGAQIIQKTLVTPDSIVGAITSRASSGIAGPKFGNWCECVCIAECGGPNWCRC